jgi:hypothetical protein
LVGNTGGESLELPDGVGNTGGSLELPAIVGAGVGVGVGAAIGGLSCQSSTDDFAPNEHRSVPNPNTGFMFVLNVNGVCLVSAALLTANPNPA